MARPLPLLAFLLHLLMLVTLAAMGCGYCATQTTVRKHGILSIICSLPHLMSLLLSNTLPHPPPSLPPLSPLYPPSLYSCENM
jgi:hypothetical protein